MKLISAMIAVMLSANGVSVPDSFSRPEYPAAHAETIAAVPAQQQAQLEAKYPNFVHKEKIQTAKDTYEIYYWNTGDFDYTQFLIMRNQGVIFDSKKTGIRIEGGLKVNPVKNQWAETVSLRGQTAFRFELADNRPESANLLVEALNGRMQTTVHDAVNLEFRDVNNDGRKELLSAPYLGQMPLGPAPVSVYEWKNGHYVPNVAETRKFWESELKRREQAFRAKPSEASLDAVVSAYLLLDRRSEGLKCFDLYREWAGTTAGGKALVDKYYNYLNKKQYEIPLNWMKQAQPLSK
ncbi:hypothetical protein [Paenibacillus donghaensis]|uniref:Uncharacterized protein n=1 Tax=Paenibacillus donghaensis TaxID=414771 RepID=A0A2Z2KQI2_9BACL|nr:hypothetical protein [Paenibacillus donghaensis]ASA21128.1 hypothetical protein B9T62_10215 [Paenibacillus donghaensis]